MNYLLQFAMVSRNFEINVGYERFSMIQYSKNTIGFGYHIPLHTRIGNLNIKSLVHDKKHISLKINKIKNLKLG